LARAMTGSAYSGTKDVSEALRFDPRRLDDYMARHVPGFAGPSTVSQFKGGQSNPTYLIETPARKYVLRRKPPGKLLPSAHAVEREYQVMTALAATGFPVPQTYALCTDESVTGTAFFVMDHVEGRIFWDARLPGLAPPERAGIYDQMNATLARLHTIDYQAIGLSEYGKTGGYVARQIARWTTQYRLSETDRVEPMEKLIDWLPAHVPGDEVTSVVHGDYRLDNLIVAAREPKIVAVLDWELSTLGDPLADFTYHLMQWHMPPEETGAGTGSLVGCDLSRLGIPTLESYVDAYVSRTGLDPRPYLPVYLAYNFFRIAAILQGIAGRVRDGTATSEHAAAKAQMVRPLAETAWGFAREAGIRSI